MQRQHKNFLLIIFLPIFAIVFFFVRHEVVLTKDFTRVSLDRGGYLRDVAEPITIIRVISWSDGGSLGILFEDSRRVEKAACLEDDLDGNKNLTFGAMTPGPIGRVQVGGIEEKAFIGLSQRWQRQYAEAQAMNNRMEANRQFRFSGDETDLQRTKAMAVALVRKILKRN